MNVAVNETTVSASGLVITPAFETTAALLDTHEITISPSALGKVKFLVTLDAESPSAKTNATWSSAASTASLSGFAGVSQATKPSTATSINTSATIPFVKLNFLVLIFDFLPPFLLIKFYTAHPW